MKKIGVVTDSHSGITQKEAKQLGIKVLPMPFYVDEECFFEEVSFTRQEFYDRLRSGANVSTSQPAPTSVMEIWDEALKEYEKVIYMPISSGLSGSCAAAQAMAEEAPYKGRILVVDNGRVSTLLHRAVLDALELIEEGYTAEEIKEILEAAKADMGIYVGVETLEYLKKGGRLSATAAALGSVLNIKPVLKFDIGSLDAYKKCRGTAKAKKVMLEAVKEDLETTYKKWYDKGEVYLVAASSSSRQATEEWVREIQETFGKAEVLCDDLSLGVSCHVGYDGLGIGYSCRPQRPQRHNAP